MDRRFYIFYSIPVVLILAVLGICSAFLPVREYSENENRFLNGFPEITAESVLSGEYQEKYESAFSDQFPARDFFMKTSTASKLAMGFKDVGDVYFGKDGYLFAKTRQREIDQKQYLNNLRYVEYLGQKNQGKTSLILVPSPAVVLKEYLPSNAPYYDAQAMYREASTVLKETKDIDVYTQMEQYAKQNQVYFKTDHHWTLLGAYAAYASYCEQTKQQKHIYSYFSAKKISDSFYGSMYSKALAPGAKPDDFYAAVNVPQAEVVSDGEKKNGIYDVESLMKKDKYAYFFGGNYGETQISSHTKAKKRMLVIKDSFANSFVPFLMESYGEITMIDLRYYNASVSKLIAGENYDQILILYEMSNFANDTNLYKLTR